MKKFAIAALMIILSTTLFAQQRGQQRGQEQGQRPDKTKATQAIITSLEKQVELDDTQTKAIETAWYAFFDEMDEQMTPGQRPDRTVMEKMEEERDAAVKAVLTEDAYKSYQKIIEEQKKNRGRK